MPLFSWFTSHSVRLMRCGFVCILLLYAASTFAQPGPIGSWRVHIPFKNPVAVANAGQTIWCGAELSIFSYAKEDNSISRYSKVNGLSDVELRGMFYNPQKDAVVVAYLNSNIDVLTEGTTFNFPSIKTQNIVGDKNVYHASFLGDSIFLSCGFGIVVLNPEKRESPASWFFNTPEGTPIRVNSSAPFNGAIYAATEKGLYIGELSNSLLEDFSSWQLDTLLNEDNVDLLFTHQGILYCQQDSIIFEWDGADWLPWDFENNWLTVSANSSEGKIVMCQWQGGTETPDKARIKIVDTDEGTAEFIIDSVKLPAPSMAVLDEDGSLWASDLFQGLIHKTDLITESIIPDGPFSEKSFAMTSYGDHLFVAPGEVNGSWNKQYNQDGFFEFTFDNWNNHNRFNISELDSLDDILSIEADPVSGTVYVGSFGGGVLEIAESGNTVYKQNSALQPAVGDESNYRVSGLALDDEGNLWISNHGAGRPVVVRDNTGDWYSFDPGLPVSVGNQLGEVIVDDWNQKWFVLPRGNGILVYDHGTDIASASDDRSRQMGLGEGNGNLNTKDVNCLVKDLDGEIWVGTEEGITVFFNPGLALEGGTSADASQIFVEFGEFDGFLLEEEQVSCIAVDGGNQKWIGTANGVFLVSADGTEQLEYFNSQNSPLPSDDIQSIGINGVSGEVFIGTSKGIVSYRGEATEGGFVHENVLVFPNPVREDYDGPITIDGLVTDADIKITDVSGKLVYQTTALGGRAIWNGKLLNGKRAGTGVYLVFSSDADGLETFIAKFLFIH